MTNLTSGGTVEQIVQLCGEGALKPFTDLLAAKVGGTDLSSDRIRIRIQGKKSLNLFRTILKSRRKIFSNLYLNLRETTFLVSDFKKFELCFSLNFIPLDPDLHSECGSGSRSTDPNECGSDRIRIHITGS